MLGLATALACGAAVPGLGAGLPELDPADQVHQVEGLPVGLAVLPIRFQ